MFNNFIGNPSLIWELRCIVQCIFTSQYASLYYTVPLDEYMHLHVTRVLKNIVIGTMLGLKFRTPVRMPHPISVHWAVLQAPAPDQLPSMMQQGLAPAVGFLPFTWRTWSGFQASIGIWEWTKHSATLSFSAFHIGNIKNFKHHTLCNMEFFFLNSGLPYFEILAKSTEEAEPLPQKVQEGNSDRCLDFFIRAQSQDGKRTLRRPWGSCLFKTISQF